MPHKSVAFKSQNPEVQFGGVLRVEVQQWAVNAHFMAVEPVVFVVEQEGVEAVVSGQMRLLKVEGFVKRMVRDAH